MKGNISITNEFKAPRKLLILTLIFANLERYEFLLIEEMIPTIKTLDFTTMDLVKMNREQFYQNENVNSRPHWWVT